MADMGRRAVPTWYWIVAGLALLWEAIGCFMYLTQVTMDAADLAALPPAQREVWAAMPSWLWAVYAVAVWVGLAGAIALLLRRRLAVPALLVSLLVIGVQYGVIFTATPILRVMPAMEALMLPLVIAFAGLLLFLFARASHRRGWLL